MENGICCGEMRRKRPFEGLEGSPAEAEAERGAGVGRGGARGGVVRGVGGGRGLSGLLLSPSWPPPLFSHPILRPHNGGIALIVVPRRRMILLLPTLLSHM